MRIVSCGNSRKARSGRNSSRPDRRSISYQDPMRELSPLLVEKGRAGTAGDASPQKYAESKRPARGDDVSPHITPGQSNRGSMIWIPGGDFLMGSNAFYREERPVRRETVHGFWI